MKKLKKIFISIAIATFIMLAPNKSFAILPFGPVFDPLNVAGESATVFATVANKILNGIISIEDRANNLKKALAEKIAGIIDGKRKPGKLPGAKVVADSKYVNYFDEKAVREKIYELFFIYPEDEDSPDMNMVEIAYETKATEFYQDNLIEVWAAVRGLDTELEKIRSDHAKIKDELSVENNGSANLGINELWKNTYEAYKTYDSLYALIEEITAMKAQLLMSKAIDQDVSPTYKKDLQSSLMTYEANTAFASQDIEPQNPEAEAVKEEESADNALFKETPSASTRTMPFASTKDQSLELKKFEKVYHTLEKALDYHNTINTLPEHKDLLIKFDKMQQLHEKSKEMLEISDNCAITFLSRHFSNPQSIWSKRDMTGQNNEHDLRKGLSGWAYELFTVQKADINKEIEEARLDGIDEDADNNEDKYKNATAKENQSINAQELVSQDIAKDNAEVVFETSDPYGDKAHFVTKAPESVQLGETVITKAPENKFDEEAQNKEVEISIKKIETNDTNGFASQSEGEQAQEDIRKQGQMYWNIGATAIKDLLDNPQKWGANLKTPYDVWPDNKMFYEQYLHKKYDNIGSFLKTASSEIILDNIKELLEENKKQYEDQKIKELGTQATSSIKQATQKSYQLIISQIEDDFEDRIKNIDKIINSYKQKVSNLDYKEFSHSNHHIFKKLHTDMFNEIGLNSIVVPKIDAESVLTTINIADEIFKSSQTSKSSYQTTDDQYFVGKKPTKRDLLMPKALPEMELPNPREVIYFDEVDWVNAGGKSGFSKEKFANYGGSLPEVIKLMLKNKTFVETDFDLDLALKDTPYSKYSQIEFSRSGRYPCILSNYVIDVDDGSYLLSVANATHKQKYSNCVAETAIEKSKQDNLYLIQNTKGISSGTLLETSEHLDAPTSALAVFLKGSRAFNDLPSTVFKNIDQEKTSGKATTPEDTYKEFLRNVMPYKHNQIGDFLRVAEEEAELRKSVDELSADVENMKWGEADAQGQRSGGLYGKIQELGDYTIADDFSLTKDIDYNFLLDLLVNGKDNKVADAELMLADIQTINNDVAKNKKEEYQSIIDALKLDNQAFIKLGFSPPSKTQLELQIKEKTVETEANSRYQEQADDSLTQDINEFQKPYCAAY